MSGYSPPDNTTDDSDYVPNLHDMSLDDLLAEREKLENGLKKMNEDGSEGNKAAGEEKEAATVREIKGEMATCENEDEKEDDVEIELNKEGC